MASQDGDKGPPYGFEGYLQSCLEVIGVQHFPHSHTWIELTDTGERRESIGAIMSFNSILSVNSQAISPQVHSKIKEWLAECHSSHSTCQQCQLGELKANTMPKYLLDLKFKQDQVRLKQTNSTEGVISYGALSYCWGGPQPQETISTNIASYMEGISIQSLPLTIQDAITLSRILDIKYLWVDSMCIVQDMAAEKQQELGKMGAIYHNAYLVISAACAATCHDGFFQGQQASPSTFGVPPGEGGSTSLTVQRPTVKLGMDARDRNDPLDKRAWTYQESFLARRLLTITSQEVIWSCVQTGGDGDGRRNTALAMMDFNDSCRFMSNMPDLKDWCHIATTFSKRSMSFESDKLPALSGLAELFDRGRGSQYLAGVWATGALQLLTWGTHWTADITSPPIRPAQWRAPSWSYMSINGPISFNDIFGGNKGISAFKGFGWEIDDFHTELRSKENPFGEVLSASMSLKCKLMEAQVTERFNGLPSQRMYSLKPACASHEFVWPKNGTPDDWGVTFDAMNPATESDPPSIASCYGSLPLNTLLSWFLMWRAEKCEDFRPLENPVEIIYGLALAQLPDGRYHRVGYISCFSKQGESVFSQLVRMPYRKFTFV